ALERFLHSGVRQAAGRVLELHALHADGREFPIELTITGWDEGDIRAVAAILRDTSSRTALLAEVSQRARELEDINRELAAFSYSVSHDLRAPLRGIMGFGQALREEYAAQLSGPGLDYLARVEAAASRMGELIDDLLELSRVSRTELACEPVDLAAYAERVIAELRQHTPERRVTFTRPEALWVLGDPRLLGVVLRNLLDNAWKFTATATHARIELGSRQVGAELRHFVRDNGAGFDMRYADKLFDVFQRLHSEAEFPGTGVGL
ncbi:MAG: histidine kinase dimerization/phospho-acceptor domain-containing protein, partial [Gemmatimonadaceae bacterium]